MIAEEIFKGTSRSPAETMEWGKRLGARLGAGDVVNLRGGLGAGKTVFVKGIAAGMGIDPDEVQSPTFTLVREYRTEGARLYHLDLFRLDAPEAEIFDAGIDAYLPSRDGATAVEWGERVPSLLPVPRFDVAIRPDGGGREVALFGVGLDRARLEAMRRLFSGPLREGRA